MCEMMNPNVPVGCMGAIQFPQDGQAGSGDVIVPASKKVSKQKPSATVLDFDKFMKLKNKKKMKIKKINEYRNDDRYYYFSESSLSREVYVPDTFDDEFKQQFDDMTNKQLYDAVGELYDFVTGDTKPNMNDRDELLSWIYEYACGMIDEQM